MAVYQLNRPDIETIINYCNDLDAGEKLEVFEFGKDCDLVLHCYHQHCQKRRMGR